MATIGSSTSGGPRLWGKWVVHNPWAIILIAVFTLAASMLVKSRSRNHHVRVAFTNATLISAGLDAKIDGVDAGKVDRVDYHDGRAVISLGIDDDRWPLHVGTRARVRWGTTVGSGTRWVELDPGPRDAPVIREDGIIDVAYTKPAIEVDQVLDMLDQRTRGDVRGVAHGLEASLRGRSQNVNHAFGVAPQAIEGADAMVGELASNTNALRGFVSHTGALTRTLAARRGQVADLVTVAAATFQAFASRTARVGQSIGALAPTLRRARSLLARVDGSVDGLQPLVDELRPGAERLRPLVAAAGPAVGQLRQTVAPALATVRTATKVAPTVTSLLDAGTPFADKLAGVAKPLAPKLACMRPYAPEAAGLLVNGSSWVANYTLRPAGPPTGDLKTGRLDGSAGGHEGTYVRQHYARVFVTAGSESFDSWPLMNSDLFGKLTGKGYALVRPPGYYAKQPQFMPECGYTPAGVDASKDPEDLPLGDRKPWEDGR